MAQEVDKLYRAMFRARGHSLVQDTSVDHLYHAMVSSPFLLLNLEKRSPSISQTDLFSTQNLVIYIFKSRDSAHEMRCSLP